MMDPLDTSPLRIGVLVLLCGLALYATLLLIGVQSCLP